MIELNAIAGGAEILIATASYRTTGLRSLSAVLSISEEGRVFYSAAFVSLQSACSSDSKCMDGWGAGSQHIYECLVYFSIVGIVAELKALDLYYQSYWWNGSIVTAPHTRRHVFSS